MNVWTLLLVIVVYVYLARLIIKNLYLWERNCYNKREGRYYTSREIMDRNDKGLAIGICVVGVIIIITFFVRAYLDML